MERAIKSSVTLTYAAFFGRGTAAFAPRLFYCRIAQVTIIFDAAASDGEHGIGAEAKQLLLPAVAVFDLISALFGGVERFFQI